VESSLKVAAGFLGLVQCRRLVAEALLQQGAFAL
jgi:hypothetical protein